jgi:copper chaperone CopZ
MTCGHCVRAVSDEVTAIAGVSEVRVDLVPGGTSTLTVTSTPPVAEPEVAAALQEAGDYTLTHD